MHGRSTNRRRLVAVVLALVVSFVVVGWLPAGASNAVATEGPCDSTPTLPTCVTDPPTSAVVSTSLNLLVPGPVDVSGQPISTTTTTAPAVAADDDNTGTVVAIVIAALLVVALLLTMLTVWYWRKTKPVRTEPEADSDGRADRVAPLARRPGEESERTAAVR